MEPTTEKPTVQGLYWVWDRGNWYFVLIVPVVLMSGKTKLMAASVFSHQYASSADNIYCELDKFEWFIGPIVKPPPPTKDAA